LANILVTGASGFVGRAVVSLLCQQHNVVSPVRAPGSGEGASKIAYPVFPDLFELALETELLSKQDIVIHIAAKAHSADVSSDEFKKVNTDLTLSLARAAAKSGVKRFIFLSSIGVNGITNTRPFSVHDTPCPVEEYAKSKLLAENGLKDIAIETGMEVVIIRPPLVYGAGAPGNFGKLIKLTKKNLPLPLGAIHNIRSLLALDNLVDLINICIDHPAAANQTFLVSDDRDISTTELLTFLTKAAGKKPRLLPVPVSWLNAIGRITGKQSIIDRLCGNLQVDISHTKTTLGWKPPISVEEGIRRCFTDV